VGLGTTLAIQARLPTTQIEVIPSKLTTSTPPFPGVSKPCALPPAHDRMWARKVPDQRQHEERLFQVI